MTALPRMEAARWQCDRHIAALRWALGDWQARPPRPCQAVEADVAAVRLLDQILYRFSKLQAAAGERLAPATLAQLAEAHEDWPMRDRLDRLERLGYVEAVQWLGWRAARDRLSHGYPDAPELCWAALGDAVQAVQGLIECVDAWQARL